MSIAIEEIDLDIIAETRRWHQGGVRLRRSGKVARPKGFEPLAFRSGGERSIQLSYGRIAFLEPNHTPRCTPVQFAAVSCARLPCVDAAAMLFG